MSWSMGHIVIILLVFAAGLFIGVKQPGTVSKFTGGLLKAG